MKKLLKTSILVGIFMAILTIKSHAAATTANVNYGTLQSNGSMEVTVTLHNDTSANEGFRSSVAEDGWTFTDTMTMKKTYTGVDTKPAFKFFSYEINGNSETISIATPFTMHVDDKYIFDQTFIFSSSNEAVVKQTDSRELTAKSAGTATISMREATSSSNVAYYNWEVTVVNGTTPTPDPDPTPDPTPAGATDFSGLTLSFEETDRYDYIRANFSGCAKDSGHTYKMYVSKESTGSADYDSNNLEPFIVDDNGKTTIIFTTDSARMLTEYAGDKYLHIIDTYYEGSTKKANVTNKKITENIPVSRPIGARFDVYLWSPDKSYVFNNMYASTDRKVTYKVGIVNSTEVLKAFKSNESTGFTKLLSYAKEDSSPLKTSSFDIPAGYSTTLDSNLINGLNITSNTYYYVYYTLSTNDGKYVETEDVQIYKASGLGTNGSVVHFAYGSMDIPEGAEDGDEKKGTPDSNLPNAGEKMIIFAAVGVSALGAVVLFRKVKSTKIK